MAKAVKSAFKWVSHTIVGLSSFAIKPLLRALTPKIPEVDTSTQIDFQPRPDAGIPWVIGETGTTGIPIYSTVGEAKNRNLLYYTILSGGGGIDSYVSFTADGTVVVFDGPDTPESGPYRHLMWMRKQLGTETVALMPPNTLDPAVLAEWTPAHKTSGYAAAWYVLGADQKAYASGVPDPMWKLRGARAYDWRLDDTYPGGMGSHRLNDPSTWTFTKNPSLLAVAFCLGRYVNGKRVLGLGGTLSHLVMQKFTDWANVCTANNWEVGGVVYSTDSKWQVLKAICQAGGAYPTPLASKISVIFNAPRVSIATLTGADILAPPVITGTQLRRDRFNAAVPRFRSEAHGWEIVAAARFVVPEFVEQDGQFRVKELEWPLVQNVDQATQLAAYGICNSREIGPVNFTIADYLMGLEPGDCITVNEPEFGFSNQKFIIGARTRSMDGSGRGISCATETDSKHGFCLGQTGTPPPLPSLSAVDTVPSAPDPGSWVVSGGTLPGPGGSLPAIIIVGAVDDPNAIEIIIEFRPVGSTGDWSTTSRPVSATRIEITEGVAPGVNYDVRIRYRYARNTEDPSTNLVLPPVVVGAVGAGTLDGRLVGDVLNDVDLTKIATDEEIIRAVVHRGETVEAIEQVQNTANGNNTFITELKSIDGAGVGKAILSVNVDGHIGGTVLMNDGDVVSCYFVVDEFGVVGTDGVGRKVFLIDAVTGEVKFRANVAIDGNLTITGTLTTRTLALNSVTIPLVTTDATTMYCDGTDKVFISHVVDLTDDAVVFVNTILSSHFPSGDRLWSATLWIDGYPEFTCGGANGVPTMPMSGARPCAAGEIEVKVTLNSHSSVNVTDKTLSSLGPMR